MLSLISYISWFYRLRPAVCHGPFKALDQASQALIEPKFQSEPNQLRWSPFPLPQPSEKRDWVQGLSAVLGSGHPSARSGLAIYVWTANESMNNKAFNNSDGDMLIGMNRFDLACY